MGFARNILATKADVVVKKIYSSTLTYPQIYQFSIGEQLRRASLSIVLNIVESGGRKNPKEKINLLNISFGSLKETQYLLDFTLFQKLITQKEYDEIFPLMEELARILYSIIYRKK